MLERYDYVEHVGLVPMDDGEWVAYRDTKAIQAIKADRDRLAAEVEQLHVQLAGCGVAATQDTKDSREDRAGLGDYGYSASYGAVCRRVDECIDLRDEVTRLRKALSELIDVAEMCDSWDRFPCDALAAASDALSASGRKEGVRDE